MASPIATRASPASSPHMTRSRARGVSATLAPANGAADGAADEAAPAAAGVPYAGLHAAALGMQAAHQALVRARSGPMRSLSLSPPRPPGQASQRSDPHTERWFLSGEAQILPPRPGTSVWPFSKRALPYAAQLDGTWTRERMDACAALACVRVPYRADETVSRARSNADAWILVFRQAWASTGGACRTSGSESTRFDILAAIACSMRRSSVDRITFAPLVRVLWRLSPHAQVIGREAVAANRVEPRDAHDGSAERPIEHMMPVAAAGAFDPFVFAWRSLSDEAQTVLLARLARSVALGYHVYRSRAVLSDLEVADVRLRTRERRSAGAHEEMYHGGTPGDATDYEESASTPQMRPLPQLRLGTSPRERAVQFARMHDARSPMLPNAPERATGRRNQRDTERARLSTRLRARHDAESRSARDHASLNAQELYTHLQSTQAQYFHDVLGNDDDVDAHGEALLHAAQRAQYARAAAPDDGGGYARRMAALVAQGAAHDAARARRINDERHAELHAVMESTNDDDDDDDEQCSDVEAVADSDAAHLSFAMEIERLTQAADDARRAVDGTSGDDDDDDDSDSDSDSDSEADNSVATREALSVARTEEARQADASLAAYRATHGESSDESSVQDEDEVDEDDDDDESDSESDVDVVATDGDRATLLIDERRLARSMMAEARGEDVGDAPDSSESMSVDRNVNGAAATSGPLPNRNAAPVPALTQHQMALAYARRERGIDAMNTDA